MSTPDGNEQKPGRGSARRNVLHLDPGFVALEGTLAVPLLDPAANILGLDVLAFSARHAATLL